MKAIRDVISCSSRCSSARRLLRAIDLHAPAAGCAMELTSTCAATSSELSASVPVARRATRWRARPHRFFSCTDLQIASYAGRSSCRYSPSMKHDMFFPPTEKCRMYVNMFGYGL